MKIRPVITLLSSLASSGSIKFACIQLTTRCNAKCADRCNIWSQPPYDMSLRNAEYALNVLSKKGYAVAYFTGGETGLYPYLSEVMAHARKRGFLTSLTTNGTIPQKTLQSLRRNLDVLSVSVDHYDKAKWDQAKNLPGVAEKAIKTVGQAQALGIKVYAITFLNPTWTAQDVEKLIRFVNVELGVGFTLSYPYISASNGSFIVGGSLRSRGAAPKQNMTELLTKVLEMKEAGFKVANASCYLRDALRALNNTPIRYPCKAGENIIAIDCNLNVFPCYKKQKLFNLKNKPNLTLPKTDNASCDNSNCLINGYKEPSLAARRNFPLAIAEELLSSPSFYSRLLF